jgi:ethanolamine utilization protein EutN
MSPQKEDAVYLGEVIGTCVATMKAPGMEGLRMLVVQPLDEHGNPTGTRHIACDAVQAGPGDRVYLVGSREAALAFDPSFVPIDAAIVGIVDSVDLDRREGDV